MMISTPRRLACLFIVLVGAPAVAVADKASEAKAHVAKATKAHQDGDFAQARIELEAAYALDPKPELLYALGQVHAKLGDCGEATSYYKRFAAAQADHQVAKVVDQAIASCKPASEPEPVPEGSPAAPPDRPSPEPAPRATTAGPSPAVRPQPFSGTRPAPADAAVERTPWYKDKLGDGLVLGGVAATVVGLLQYRSALSDLDEAEDRTRTTTLARYEELVDSASGKRTTSIILVGAGGALVAAGIVRYVLVDRSTETRSVGVAPARGGGVVTYGGSF